MGLFQIGSINKNLKKYQLAIDTFKDLIRKYPMITGHARRNGKWKTPSGTRVQGGSALTDSHHLPCEETLSPSPCDFVHGDHDGRCNGGS